MNERNTGQNTRFQVANQKKSKCEKSKSHISALPTGKATKSIRDRIVYFAAFCGFHADRMRDDVVVVPSEKKTTKSKNCVTPGSMGFVCIPFDATA